MTFTPNPTDKTIKIYIEGGCLIDVTNLPPEYDYELIDYDNQEVEESKQEEKLAAPIKHK